LRNVCNSQNLMHFDLSFNQFKKEDSKKIANSVNQNTSIIGFHYQGHDCYINGNGNLKEMKEESKSESQYQKFHSTSTVRLDGVRFKGFNEY
jgi:hypothetical protein